MPTAWWLQRHLAGGTVHPQIIEYSPADKEQIDRLDFAIDFPFDQSSEYTIVGKQPKRYHSIIHFVIDESVQCVLGQQLFHRQHTESVWQLASEWELVLLAAA